ncbi:hypothetical protein KUTeg_022031 [Tegillarca granosa]|uniref:ALOG domain-containing protein n=1 Tax=Tegillarca granosa TaxID=220873 RepID=A0ABQ9E9F1_TEGGR|nr:hypothetical protein KUTeg_022031 [Tegillarca granosa]
MTDFIVLGNKRDKDILLFPSKLGYKTSGKGLLTDLLACCGNSNHVSVVNQNQNLTSVYSERQRILYLNDLLDSKSYDKKKLNFKRDFEKFLLVRSKSLYTAESENIRTFLIDKDKAGKTQIHDLSCFNLGLTRMHNCSCPKRLYFGTVSSYISQMSLFFNDVGCEEPWIENLSFQTGNPVRNRANDLSLTVVLEVKKLPGMNVGTILGNGKNKFMVPGIDDDCICPVKGFYRYIYESRMNVEKILRIGKKNKFMVPGIDDDCICPVKGFYRYIYESKQLGVELSVGHLFRSLDSSRSKVLDAHVSSSAMSDRLKSYLKVLNTRYTGWYQLIYTDKQSTAAATNNNENQHHNNIIKTELEKS